MNELATEPSAESFGSLPPAWTPPDRIGRYAILEHLGSGGMGHVYAAEDPALHRRVALKVLHVGWGRPEVEAWVRREARAMARLKHPNVVQIYDVVEHEGLLALAMEFVDGLTLEHWSRGTVRSIDEIVAVLVEAGRGLAAVHAHGIVHRDIKPSNIFVDGRGRGLVADFGVAQGLGPMPSSDGGTIDTALRTLPGAGTPRYMSPEQQRGRAIDHRSDQYSFCLCLHEALFGALPDERPRRTDVPVRLRRVLMRGLSPDPADRFATMDELLEALSRRRRPRWVFGSFAAAAAVIGVAMLARPTASACTDRASAPSETWNEEVAERMHERAAQSSAPYREDVLRMATQAMDAYADEWTAVYRESCEAREVGRWSDRLFDGAMLCLHDRLRAFEATAGLLGELDPNLLRRVNEVVDGLPDVAACRDESFLHRVPSNPDRPEVRQAIAGVEALLSEAEVREHAGDDEGARDLVLRARRAAERLDHPPLRARMQMAEADAAVPFESRAQLRERYEAAAAAAMLAHDDALAAEGWLKAAVAAIDDGDSGDAVASLLGQADALSRRIGEPRRLQGGIAAARCKMALLRHDLDEAARQAELTDRWGRQTERGSPYAVSLLAKVRFAQGDLRAALRLYEEALALDEALVGPWHPSTAISLNNVAQLQRALGEYDAAIAPLERALAIRERIYGPEHVVAFEALTRLAQVLRAAGHSERERSLLRRAVTIAERNAEDRPALSAIVALELAQSYVSGEATPDNVGEALQWSELALERAIDLDGADSTDAAIARGTFAAALRLAGRDAEARAHYELTGTNLEALYGPDNAWTHYAEVEIADIDARPEPPPSACERFDRAIARDTRADDLDPHTEALAWFGRSRCLARADAPRDAIDEALSRSRVALARCERTGETKRLADRIARWAR